MSPEGQGGSRVLPRPDQKYFIKYEISTNQRHLNLPLTNQRLDVFCVPIDAQSGEIGLTSSVRSGVGPEIMTNSSNVLIVKMQPFKNIKQYFDTRV